MRVITEVPDARSSAPNFIISSVERQLYSEVTVSYKIENACNLLFDLSIPKYSISEKRCKNRGIFSSDIGCVSSTRSSRLRLADPSTMTSLTANTLRKICSVGHHKLGNYSSNTTKEIV